MRLKSILGNIVLSTILKTMQTNGQNITGLVSSLEREESPRSLNACDRLLMPQILRDFPDFDGNLAKTYLREHLKQTYSDRKSLTIHNVAIAKYLPSRLYKTIVFQAAVSWMEHGKKVQKRFNIDYTYLLSTASKTVAANCPNCAGAIGYGETECSYCGSRVSSPMGESWKVTNIAES